MLRIPAPSLLRGATRLRGAALALAFVAALLALTATAPAAAAQPRWLRPVGGEVLRDFSFSAADRFAGGWHRGVTFAAPEGADVRAPCGGPVSWAGEVGSAGRGVTIECGRLNATLTHLGAALVRPGDVAAPGEVVGRAGGDVQLGARIRARPAGYLDPMSFLHRSHGPTLGPAPSPRLTSRPPSTAAPAAQHAPAQQPAPASDPFADLPGPGPEGALGIGLFVAAMIMKALRSLTPAARKGLARRAARLVEARRTR